MSFQSKVQTLLTLIICSVSEQAALPSHNFTTRYKDLLMQTVF